MAFSSLRLILAWVTATAVAYSLVSVMAGPGLDFEVGQDHVFAGRLSVMYLVAVAISLLVRFERTRWLAAMARERQAHQDQIDLSQAIHDTTAQTAYMIGLGLEGAMKLAGDSNPKLVERLEATAVQVGHVGAEEADRHGPHLRGAGPGARAGRAHRDVRQDRLRPCRDAAEWPGAAAVHGGEDGSLLHCPQRPRQRIPALPSTQGRGQLDFEAAGTRLSVSDDGVGLPEDYAERGRGFKGMETDAERMGGRLIVESGGPEGGLTSPALFPMNLPEGETEMSSTNGIRVMLVDDHSIMRRGLKEVLEDAGAFEVVAQAADGAEAVRTVEESRPDVIIMDVMMPGKDGVEACRDILDLLPEMRC